MPRLWVRSTLLFAFCLLPACGDDGDPAMPTPDSGVLGSDGGISMHDCVGSEATGDPELAVGEDFRHDEVKIGSIYVDRYVWRDTAGLVRSVSLKKQCAQNAGNGGYAVRMTYQVVIGANTTTRSLNADDAGDSGWGYFVSHEAYRHFSDGTDGTIAARNNEDDSALGKGFPVVGASSVSKQGATHTFVQQYYRWGTIDAAAYDPVNNVIPTPAGTSAHRRYPLPVSLTWSFAANTDYPLVRTTVDQSMIPGFDRVFFDVRGPYGVLDFDEGKQLPIEGLVWGDRFAAFHNVAVPLTWSSGGDWSGAPPSARYHALVAGDYEMGLYEPRAVSETALVDGYAENRGKPAATLACADGAALRLPCQGEWPYQSLNYSLDPATPATPTTGQKIAWGSAAFYGSSLASVAAGPGLNQPLTGRAADARLTYDVCVVVDRPLVAQAADGVVTLQSRTAAVAGAAANRAPGGKCAVLP